MSISFADWNYEPDFGAVIQSKIDEYLCAETPQSLDEVLNALELDRADLSPEQLAQIGAAVRKACAEPH